MLSPSYMLPNPIVHQVEPVGLCYSPNATRAIVFHRPEKYGILF